MGNFKYCYTPAPPRPKNWRPKGYKRDDALELFLTVNDNEATEEDMWGGKDTYAHVVKKNTKNGKWYCMQVEFKKFVDDA